jgi:two-component system response regulator FixJ
MTSPALCRCACDPSRPAVAAEVYVIDDDPALRQALTRLFRGADLLVRTYESAVEFLEDAPRLPMGCVVADLRMPEMDGLELVRRIAAAGFPFRTIMVTGHADVRLAVEVMKAGATDFIQKPFDCNALLAAVRRALGRLATADEEGQSRDRLRETLKRITPREGDVMRGLVSGKTNKMIGLDLRISPRTVELHRANLMKKLAAETLSDLIRMSVLAEDRRPGGLGEKVPAAGL